MEQSSSRPREADIALGGPSALEAPKLHQLPTSSVPSAGAPSLPTIAIKKKHNIFESTSVNETVRTNTEDTSSCLDVTDLKALRGISNKHRAFLLKGSPYFSNLTDSSGQTL